MFSILITPITVLAHCGRSCASLRSRHLNIHVHREGRYKATLIDSEHYLLTCSRYIELNPVRAQMVDHPSEYPWSSYRHNALGKNKSLVVPHILYKRLGKSPEERQKAYRALFCTHIVRRHWMKLGQQRIKRGCLEMTGFRLKLKN